MDRQISPKPRVRLSLDDAPESIKREFLDITVEYPRENDENFGRELAREQNERMRFEPSILHVGSNQSRTNGTHEKA